ncbi:MAG: glycosyl transferase [Rhodobacteraceae bacterium]|nr:glycosyl transferase [Paracoccaceae bacterium]
MIEDGPSGPAQIAVVIVNYGTAELTAQAVDSVLQQAGAGPVPEIHVVDNASPGEDQAVLSRAKAGWPDAVVLHLETENHGFGRGNNLVLDDLAARAVPPDFVFLLNPDARLENDAITILADFLTSHPKAAFAGVGIDKPGHGPVTAAFRFPSIAGLFSRAVNFGPVDRLLARWRMRLPPDLDRQRGGWVAGAGVMMRFAALQEIGFFDPAFFLYYEETELMHRASRQGWETWYVPEARVVHLEGAATGVDSGQGARNRKPSYWYASWHHYFVKTSGRIGAMGAACAVMTGTALDLVLSRIRGNTPFAPAHFFRDFHAMVLRPLIGLAPRPYD